ncbi:bifunctional nuclease family protein [Desulfobotulus sp.]|uniref:bifunctional nuclease family protein n=1 Tax=Desulfobotulus sp. TaxID=1940337 RepID=UPI002A360AC0|nr:bifunctional nuclease family protein [Desulfobotulus sp.]MDY0162843.1 bifunctional nuclease family protein [Desulfobotulus sp.]
MFRVEIVSLTLDPASREPVMVLKKCDGDEAIPLVIGHMEAAGIAAALRKDPQKRPMVHDLFADFIRETGYRMLRAEVVDLKAGVFYARIYLGSDMEDAFYMDARPSDAVAMALRFSVPIFVDVSVWEKWEFEDVMPDPDAEAVDTSEEGQKWSAMLEKMDPDRFGHA